MAQLSSKEVREFKQAFVDAGLDDPDTTMSDLISLIDEVISPQPETDQRYLRVKSLVEDVEAARGVVITSRQRTDGL